METLNTQVLSSEFCGCMLILACSNQDSWGKVTILQNTGVKFDFQYVMAQNEQCDSFCTNTALVPGCFRGVLNDTSGIIEYTYDPNDQSCFGKVGDSLTCYSKSCSTTILTNVSQYRPNVNNCSLPTYHSPPESCSPDFCSTTGPSILTQCIAVKNRLPVEISSDYTSCDPIASLTELHGSKNFVLLENVSYTPSYSFFSGCLETCDFYIYPSSLAAMQGVSVDSSTLADIISIIFADGQAGEPVLLDKDDLKSTTIFQSYPGSFLLYDQNDCTTATISTNIIAITSDGSLRAVKQALFPLSESTGNAFCGYHCDGVACASRTCINCLNNTIGDLSCVKLFSSTAESFSTTKPCEDVNLSLPAALNCDCNIGCTAPDYNISLLEGMDLRNQKPRSPHLEICTYESFRPAGNTCTFFDNANDYRQLFCTFAQTGVVAPMDDACLSLLQIAQDNLSHFPQNSDIIATRSFGNAYSFVPNWTFFAEEPCEINFYCPDPPLVRMGDFSLIFSETLSHNLTATTTTHPGFHLCMNTDLITPNFKTFPRYYDTPAHGGYCSVLEGAVFNTTTLRHDFPTLSSMFCEITQNGTIRQETDLLRCCSVYYDQLTQYPRYAGYFDTVSFDKAIWDIAIEQETLFGVEFKIPPFCLCILPLEQTCRCRPFGSDNPVYCPCDNPKQAHIFPQSCSTTGEGQCTLNSLDIDARLQIPSNSGSILHNITQSTTNIQKFESISTHSSRQSITDILPQDIPPITALTLTYLILRVRSLWFSLLHFPAPTLTASNQDFSTTLSRHYYRITPHIRFSDRNYYYDCYGQHYNNTPAVCNVYQELCFTDDVYVTDAMPCGLCLNPTGQAKVRFQSCRFSLDAEQQYGDTFNNHLLDDITNQISLQFDANCTHTFTNPMLNGPSCVRPAIWQSSSPLFDDITYNSEHQYYKSVQSIARNQNFYMRVDWVGEFDPRAFFNIYAILSFNETGRSVSPVQFAVRSYLLHDANSASPYLLSELNHTNRSFYLHLPRDIPINSELLVTTHFYPYNDTNVLALDPELLVHNLSGYIPNAPIQFPDIIYPFSLGECLNSTSPYAQTNECVQKACMESKLSCVIYGVSTGQCAVYDDQQFIDMLPYCNCTRSFSGNGCEFTDRCSREVCNDHGAIKWNTAFHPSSTTYDAVTCQQQPCVCDAGTFWSGLRCETCDVKALYQTCHGTGQNGPIYTISNTNHTVQHHDDWSTVKLDANSLYFPIPSRFNITSSLNSCTCVCYDGFGGPYCSQAVMYSYISLNSSLIPSAWRFFDSYEISYDNGTIKKRFQYFIESIQQSLYILTGIKSILLTRIVPSNAKAYRMVLRIPVPLAISERQAVYDKWSAFITQTLNQNNDRENYQIQIPHDELSAYSPKVKLDDHTRTFFKSVLDASHAYDPTCNIDFANPIVPDLNTHKFAPFDPQRNITKVQCPSGMSLATMTPINWRDEFTSCLNQHDTTPSPECTFFWAQLPSGGGSDSFWYILVIAITVPIVVVIIIIMIILYIFCRKNHDNPEPSPLQTGKESQNLSQSPK